jgi:hypothetical protein
MGFLFTMFSETHGGISEKKKYRCFGFNTQRAACVAVSFHWTEMQQQP